MVVTASGLLSPAKNPCNPDNLGCNTGKYEPMWTIWDVVLSNSDQSCHALKLLGGLQNLCDIDRIKEPDYLPTKQDILHIKTRSNAIVEATFEREELECR